MQAPPAAGPPHPFIRQTGAPQRAHHPRAPGPPSRPSCPRPPRRALRRWRQLRPGRLRHQLPLRGSATGRPRYTTPICPSDPPPTARRRRPRIPSGLRRRTSRYPSSPSPALRAVASLLQSGRSNSRRHQPRQSLPPPAGPSVAALRPRARTASTPITRTTQRSSANPPAPTCPDSARFATSKETCQALSATASGARQSAPARTPRGTALFGSFPCARPAPVFSRPGSGTRRRGSTGTSRTPPAHCGRPSMQPCGSPRERGGRRPSTDWQRGLRRSPTSLLSLQRHLSLVPPVPAGLSSSTRRQLSSPPSGSTGRRWPTFDPPPSEPCGAGSRPSRAWQPAPASR
jgi:hypothetical protein